MESEHRGPAPKDRELFGPDQWPALRAAVADLAWLLSRGYAERSALKLVGDRHRLRARQRAAVLRSTCTDAAREARCRSRISIEALAGTVHVDGFNAIIICESALGGGPVFVGRDGASRDIASVHGTYRRVEETRGAIEGLGELLAPADEVVFWLDRPVSNSGRLRALLLELAAQRGWAWRVHLAVDPDRELMDCEGIVATADALILDGGVPWIDLPGALIEDRIPEAFRIDLR
ncbi:MAG: DUF434 domain-containing protein [Myxococcales bacterium]|nr:DUF434 domain-containing protein [Myxococcales bacterium]